MEEKWFKKSYFRNLVDMHINVGDDRLLASFDADRYAENMATAGFDTAYIYGSNCLGLCLFPSKTGYCHDITKTRDIFGETVDACRRRGIRPVGYLNNWTTTCSDKHPEWRVVGLNGKAYRDNPGHYGRYGICCPNSPYQDYFLSLVKELCSTYPIEGLWVDMVGYWNCACYCEGCKAKYRAQTGKEIPTVVDWSSPDWVEYVRFKEKALADYAEAITRTAKEANPAITVSIQCASWRSGHHTGLSNGFYAAMDYVAGDFYTDVRAAAVDCKFLRGVTKNAPFEYMVSRCPTLTLHTVSKPFELLRSQAYSAYLHGGALLFIDAIDPEGTMNPEVYRTFGKVKEELLPYWEHPACLTGEYRSDIAVYVNYPSTMLPAQNGKDTANAHADATVLHRLSTINDALAMRQEQYDIITPAKLSELSRYGVIILSEIYVLSEKEKEAFREYVKAGGRLYVSGKTGLYDDVFDAPDAKTLLRKNFSLSEVLGVCYEGRDLPYDTCYIQGTAPSRLFSESHMAYPLGTKAAASPTVRTRRGTKVLATATLPFSSNSDNRKYISAISDPPWEKTDIPVLTLHTYGKGSCVYSSLLLEANKNDEVRAFWLDIIDELLDKRRHIKVEAPRCVEVSVKETETDVFVSVFNMSYTDTGASSAPVKIRLSDMGALSEASVFPTGKVSARGGKKGITLTLSSLPEFAVVTLKKK